jgi:hypothetical protein
VEDFDWFRLREHDGRRLRSRNRLDARCRAHAGCVGVLVVVANVDRALRGDFSRSVLRAERRALQFNHMCLAISFRPPTFLLCHPIVRLQHDSSSSTS